VRENSALLQAVLYYYTIFPNNADSMQSVRLTTGDAGEVRWYGELFDPAGDFQVYFRETGYNEVKREVALSGVHTAEVHVDVQKGVCYDLIQDDIAQAMVSPTVVRLWSPDPCAAHSLLYWAGIVLLYAHSEVTAYAANLAWLFPRGATAYAANLAWSFPRGNAACSGTTGLSLGSFTRFQGLPAIQRLSCDGKWTGLGVWSPCTCYPAS